VSAVTLCDFSAYIWISVSAVSVLMTTLPGHRIPGVSAAFFFAGILALAGTAATLPVWIQAVIFFSSFLLFIFIRFFIATLSAFMRK